MRAPARSADTPGPDPRLRDSRRRRAALGRLLRRVTRLGRGEAQPERDSDVIGRLRAAAAAVRAEGVPPQSLSELANLPGEGPALLLGGRPVGRPEGQLLWALVHARRADLLLVASPRGGAWFAWAGRGKRLATPSLETAVARAREHFERGGAVLLLPAAVSSEREARLEATLAWDPRVAPLVRALARPVQLVDLRAAKQRLFAIVAAPGRLAWRAGRRVLSLGKAPDAPRPEVEPALFAGTPVLAERLAEFEDDERLLRHLRLRSHALASRGARPRVDRAKRRLPLTRKKERPIAPQVTADVLEDELGQFRPVATGGEFEVFVCTQRDAPEVLREIGRLREVTFRAVGEGTGKALDIDRFDPWYLHVVVWNASKREVVGAYRMVGTDEAFERGGVEALYTHTLFEFDRETIEALGPALELGRSFVRREYQKNYAPLMLLWRGIAEYVAANPRYRVLYGAVSITAEYQPLSQALMVHYLRLNSLHEDLAKAVHSRNPVSLRDLGSVILAEGGATLGDLKELSTLVSEVEPDRKGVPTLLKEYLKLGGRVLDFNVDEEFGDVLDALLVIDLAETPARVLGRYMGREQTAAFRAHHGLPN